jgi:anti-anti-sigma regulatory factor
VLGRSPLVVVDIDVDVGKNRIFLCVRGRVDDAEAKSIADSIIKEMGRLRPGFDIVTDLSQAEPLGPEGVNQFKRLLEAHRARKAGRAVRIVGRSKDVALQFARTSKELQHEPYLCFSREEAERWLDGEEP